MFIILFFLIFAFSIYQITSLMLSNRKNDKIYNEIKDSVKIEENISKTEHDSNFLNIDFTNLLLENSDVKGWINFNDVNYPFVQSKNNEYYLKKSFDKKYNINGTIFMDYRNNDFDDSNIVIYGHNSSDGQMFGSLKKVLKNNYFSNGGNTIIKISTISANYNFQIFSVYTIKKEEYYITTSFKDNEFKKFIDTIKKRSLYKFDSSVNTKDKILTLSTCNGSSGTSKRLVIHAKLIETELR